MYMNKIIPVLLFLVSFSLQGICQVLQPTETEALLVCIVTDQEKLPEAGLKIFVESEDKSFKKNGITDVDGKFRLLAPEGKKYQIKVEKLGDFGLYNTEIGVFDGGAEIEQPLTLKTVKTFVRSYTLNHVYFDVNKWDIKPDMIPTLDKLYQSFLKSKTLVVEIAGHTDHSGADADNIRLSQRRADAIKAYLVKKGVSEERIFAKGYGEHDPHASNDTEEGRAKNRRTEIKVIEE
jgi:OOP family OmpA-OmpF porin